MCDCFHLVLPNWPGSPASVSGRQLRPDDPDAETEEDNSVNEVPIDEIIRPRPQGSSPVYEYSIDQEHFIKGEDTQTGRFSLGRRKSRWKRDSGESQSFSGRSQSEEPMEVTLQTDVEAGASGYSVTGGGKEGIFVKQVLKDSSAAKLFSMREGDQLLSATIYFDNIKYEDALKILQYSEPYKVQFNLKRKLASKDDTEKVHHPATSDIRETDQQGEDLTDGTMETMEKMLEEEEDKEKLIVKSRTGRSQRPKKERLSWPKFQAKKTKKVVSHRRSHSTSDACEGRAPDLSPTSTDTELHFPKEETHLREKKGSERKRKFLNIGFRMHRKLEIDDKTSKSGMTTAEARTRKAKDGERISLDLQKPEMESGRLESQSATIIPEHLENEENRLKLQLQVDPGTKKQEQLTSEAKSMSGAVMGSPASVSGTLTGSHVSVRGRRKKSDDVTDTVSGSKHGLQAGKETRERLDDTSFGVRGLEIGIAKLTLQESQEDLEKGYETPEIRVKIPTLQTPKFGFSKGKVSEAKPNVSEHEREQSLGKVTVNWGEMLMEHIPERNVPPLDVTGAIGKIAVETPDLDHTVPNIPEKGAVISDWKAQISSKKMTQMSKADVSSPKMDIVISSADVSQPKVETHGPEIGKDGLKMEGEIKMGDKDIEGKDSKFKMPKFKMPSFGWSPSKEKKGSGEVALPKEEVDISKASLKRDDKDGDLTVSLISAETPIRGIDLSMKSQKGEATVKDHKDKEEMRFKESKDQMENIQIPQTSKADIEKTKVDIIIPRVDVSLPKVTLNKENVEAEVERANVKGDVRLKEKEIDHKESKFRIPKFSMPGFSWGSGKEIGSSVDIETNIKEPKTTIPSHSMDKEPGLVSKDKKVPSFDVNVQIAGGEKVKTESKTGKIPSIKVLKKADSEEKMMIEQDVEGKKQDVESTDRNLKGKIEGIAEISQKEKTTIKGIEKEIQIPEVEVEIEEMKEKTKREGVKEHMTKYSIKTAKGDIKGPKVNITMPDIDVTIPKAKDNGITTEVQVERVKMEGDMKIGDKEVEVKDGKFKMPKFKMPSFGGGKEGAALVEVSLPKAEVDVTLPSVQASELSMEVPSAEGDIKGLDIEAQLPEVQLGNLKGKTGGVSFKGHLHKVHMPSVKMPQMPKADIKGPKVDITMPSLDVSLPKGKGEIKGPEVDLEGDIKLGEKELDVKDSKFKMPKFKMPSFGGGQEGAASVEVSLPKAEVDVTLPSVEAGDLSVEVPTVDVDIKGLDTEGQLPEGEVQLGDLKGKSGGISLKSHLPTVHMPSVKMPQMPKADIKGPKVDITMPSLDVSLPKGKAHIKSPKVEGEAVTVEGNIKLGDKEVEGKDSKFKMPKFKMPSFGGGKEGAASVDMSLPKAEVDATLPSVQAGDLSVEVPSVDVEVKGLDLETKLPEGKVQLGDLKEKSGGISLKGHLPTVHMPSVKMPQMPKADIKGPKVDNTMPSFDVSLPKSKGDIKGPQVKVEGDIKLGDKEVEAKDSKFKMPKFKMPSFGGGKQGEASVNMSLPKEEVDMTLPSLTVEVKPGDLSVELPSMDVEVKGLDIETKLPEAEVQLGDRKGKTESVGLKGHLPKVHMPSMKMPQMPKADIKAPKVDITMPSLDVSLPKGKGEIKSPEVGEEGDIKLGDKEVEAKDSKFKMPKFKMPSFGGGKEKAASVDMSLPKAEVDVTLPSVQAGELSVEVPSAEVDIKGLDIEAQLPEVQLGDLKGKTGVVGLKEHLPSVKMPQMTKADIKAPKVDITMPSLDVSLPKGKGDIKSPKVEMEGDIKLGDKEVEVKDSKFKMPKFKMPSFGVSAPGKEGKATVDTSLPNAEVDVTLPSVEVEVKPSDLSVEVPAVDVEVKGLDIETKLPEGEVQLGDLKGKSGDISLKGHLPTVHMPSVKMPQMPKADIKGPKLDITMPSLDVSLPKGKGDIKSPEVEMEGDIKLGDKEVEVKDSKFKMPKFKMPSFGVSAPGKEGKATVDASLPKAEVDVTLPSVEVEVKPSDLSVEVPSVDVDVKGVDIETKLPEGEVQLGDLKGKSGDISLKGHLPEVHMPSMKMSQIPKADIKGPKVDITMPSLDVSLPKGKGDIKSPKVEVEGDIKLGDKEVEAKDSKFKMPKFKMPCFGGGKEGVTSVDVSLPKAEVDVTLPSVEVEAKPSDLSVEVPAVDVEVKGLDIETKLPEGEVQLGDLKGKSGGISLKGHLPTVHMPSVKMPQMPKADIKGPKLNITMPSLDMSLPKGKGDIKSPEVKMEGDIELGDKEVEVKDSKFKMPKFKMPSFGVSATGKEGKATVDTTLPKAEVDVTLPSVEVEVKPSDLSVEVPSVALDVKELDIETKLPEGEVQLGDLKGKSGDISLKGHLPTVHMPSMKMSQIPKADIKSPKVDITMPSLDVSLPKGKGDIKSPKVEVEGDIKLGDKEVEAKDSKFKMPKFKMPSFGGGKEGATSMDVSLPKAEVDVTLPSVQSGDLSVEMPSVDVEVKGLDIEAQLAEGEVQLGDLKGKTEGLSLKGQLPTVHMPSMKMPQMPKADIKAPQVDITMPSLDVSLPKGKGDIKSPEVKMEGDIKLGDKEVEVKDSKFKMPKFKMPSFGGGKEGAASVDVSLPKAEVDVTLPSAQSGDLSGEMPSVDVEVKGLDIEAQLPEVQLGDLKGKTSGVGLKGHLSSVKMPQMPKADIKAPKVDFTMPSLDMSLPKGKGDIKSPKVEVEGDIKLGEKEVEAKDNKFKMPKFKMPSFGGGKEGAASVDVSVPKAEVNVTLPSVEAGDLSGEVPAVDVKGLDIETKLPEGEVQLGDLKGKSGDISLKGHLPKVHMPSMKMSQIPKADIKAPKVDITMPSLDVSLPKGKGDIKSPKVEVEGDMKLGDKEVAVKDSKFKMPKFKMPSFGGGKEGAASVDVSLPKAEVDVTLPSVEVEVKPSDLSVEVPSVALDVKELDIEAKLPEGEVQLGDLKGKSGDISLKGHLPKVHMPSMKMSQIPKADIKSPKVDITMPSLDVSLPKGKGDIKSPKVEVEGDIELGDKEVEAKDSKFKMPKFKMPSFGGGKEGAVSVDVSLPKAEVDVTLPSVQSSDLSVEMPSVDVGVKGLDIEAQLAEGEVQLGDLKGKTEGLSLKGQLPTVHMPSMKMPQMPKADIKAPQVDITMPSLDVSLSKGKGDIKSPEVKMEGDIKLGDKEVEVKDSKFKMPKFNMPSFGVSAPGKEGKATVDASLPKAEVDVTLPSVEVEVKPSDLSVEVPSVDVDVKGVDIETKLPEGEVQLGDLKGKSGDISLKGHLPKVHMPSMKMSQIPKADIKAPKVDITMPSLDVSLPKGKGDIKSPKVEVEGDIKLGDKEVEAKDSKFKMPKFKMPSFGGGKEGVTSGDVSLPKAEVDVTLPSVEVEAKPSDLSVEVPAVDVEVKGLDIETKLPEGEVQLGDLKGKSGGISLKGHLPTVHMPSVKMPQMPKADIKGPQLDITMPSLDVSLPTGKGDNKSPEVEMEGDIELGDKEVEVKDSKFKMPKFKMPSFGVSAPGKEGKATVDTSLPKAEVDVTLPSVEVEVKPSDLSVEVPSVDVDVKGVDIETKLPEGEVQLGDLKGKSGDISLKGHLPKVHMPSMKMSQIPKADIKAPKVDITMPSLDVSLPKGKGDIKSPKVEVEGDMKLGDKEVAVKDSKFKMPKFKMPSFGGGKEGAASVDVSLPKAEVDVTLPSVEVEVKPSDLSVEVPSVALDVKELDIEAKLPEGEVQLGDLKGKSGDISLKGHLPKVHMPSMKMSQIPKADIKSPKVDITMPSLDVSLPKGKGDIKSPKVEVEGDIELGDKEVEAKDSKFKMPKFKMPSFGGGKEGAVSVDVSLPKAEVDVTLPSVQSSDLSVEMPSVDVGVKGLDIEAQLAEGEVQLGDLKGKTEGLSLKGQLPTVHMHSMKMPQMPKADIKAPQVDITMPSLDVSLSKGKGDIKSPEVKMEGDIKLGDKEVEVKDSKFKMPKFNMPSFGVSAPGKEGKATVDASLPKAEVDVTLPSVEVEVKPSDLSVEVPSVDVDVKGVDIETKLPEGEVQLGDLKGKSGDISLKGHLPKVHMPSMKMSQIPKADIKAPKVDITMPSLDVSLPKGKGDIKSPKVEVEGDIKLGDKEVEAKDSKFKMPKFKMPSFGGGKEGVTSGDVSLPKAEVDVTLPSVEVEAKPSDLSVEVPAVDVEVKGLDIETKLPEGEVQLGDLKGKSGGISLKGHLPTVHMPSVKMPQMPKADIKGPQLDITMPSLDVSLPKGKGDNKSPEVEMEGDIELGDKEVEVKDSKFKMPKFKMPSFGVSAPGKEGKATVDTSLPKAEVDVTLPSVEVEVKPSDLSVEVPSVDVDVKGVDIETKLPEGEVQLGDLKGKSGDISLKGHLPKVHMPSMKMSQIPKADIKAPKVDITMPSLDVSLPKGKGDIKSPKVEVEGDMKLGDKEVAVKDSKFKMPKFKMPSFGGGKEGAASVDVSLPKAEVDVTLPSVEVEVKPSDLSVEVPSVALDVKELDIEAKLPEGEVQLGDLKEKSGDISLKGHLPKVHMPSMKMSQIPKADIKSPKVDITMPSLDVSLPKGKGDIKSPKVEVEGDIELGDKEVEAKDSKFKMPKFKMPSFGGGKEGAVSVDVSLPKAEVDVTLPSVQSSDLSVEMPSVDVEVKGLDIEAQLAEGEVQLGDLKGKTEGLSLKGQLPTVHMPSMKMPQMPKADIKAPQVDITMPSLDVSLSKGKGDIKSPEVKMEGDIKLGDKEVEVKDSKFKMPKFNMPSFGVSAPGKEGKATVDASLPKAEVDVTLPSVEVEVKPSDLSVEVPSVDVDVKGVDIETKLPEGEVQLGDLKGKSGDISLKGHLPKVHMPSMKMSQIPKADIKAPQVDITMPSLDVSLPKGKGDIKSPKVEVEGDIKLGDKEVEAKDSKFKMPKFKMPSFGGGKEGATSGDVSLPKAEVDVTLPSVEVEAKPSDLSVEVPAVDVEVKGLDIETKLPEGEVQLGDLKGKSGGISLKGHLPTVHMPSVKMPQMPKADIKGPKLNITMPSLDMSLPKGKGDIKSPEVEMEGDIELGDKEVEVKDSKFKMPKFKMPSFGVSATGKEGKATVDTTLPKAEVDVTLPSVEVEVKPSDLSVEVPSVDVDVKGVDIETKLPEGEVQLGDLKGKSGDISLKGHLPKVHMPSMKMSQIPKADIKAPKVDITMPSLDVSLPKGKGDIKSPKVEVEGDIKLGDKEVEAKDSKFKMPKFKMPSFGGGKEGATSGDVSLPKAEVDVTLPSVEVEAKPSDLSVEVPAVDVEVKGLDIETKLPEGEVQLGDLKGKSGGISLKGHLPTVHMPSVKMPQMPKADIKGPKLNITMPSLDMSLPKGKGDIKSPEVEMEGDIKLGDKEVEVKDSKFKMPKFKMPSFGVSAPGKEGKATVDASLPKAEVDVTLPSVEVEVKPSDLSVEVPSVALDVKELDIEAKLPEGEVQLGDLKGKSGDISLKGHLPKVHMPSTKMSQIPKADIKASKVDITMPSLDVSLPKGKGDIKSPKVEVEGDIKLGDKEVEAKDSKFKMPKFKMPSFGGGKEGAISVDVSLPKAGVDVTLPSVEVEVKPSDLNVEVPAVDVEVKGLAIETKLPEGEVQLGDLKGKSGGISLKGHLPTVHMPSVKMPQMPKADIKGSKLDITMPSLDVSLPKGKGDIKSLEVGMEGDIELGDKEVEVKDSKFKMPKFKMPSFGVSAPGKEGKATVDASLPKAELDVTLPSVEVEVKPSDPSVEVPSVDVEVKGLDIDTKLPEGEVQLGDLKGKTGSVGLKGHLPKVNMPSVKMPQMPKADIKGPKVDITMPSLDMSLPKGKGDGKSSAVQVEAVKVEGDIKLGDKKVEAKHSKFKMPKFKMPSFGEGKEGPVSVDMSLPKAEVDVTLPSVQAGDLSVEAPSVDVEVKGLDIDTKLPEEEAQLVDLKGKSGSVGLKGHLPKVHMPSMKMPHMPKVDIKGPQVDITMPSLDVSLPKDKGDIKSPDVEVEAVKVEEDIKVGDKEIEVKDRKFKMPKFKMPSFGGVKEGEPSVDLSLPKAEVDVSLPSVKLGDLNVEVPSVDVEVKGLDIEAQLPEGEIQLGDLKGKSGSVGLKGHLPKVHMPSMKMPQMPKADIKGPQVDITMPSLDVSLPKGKGDIKSPEVEVEGDIKLGEKEVEVKDSKFKMPKFKMPSFGMSAPGKEGKVSVDASLPQTEVDVTLPSVEIEVKPSDLSVEVPSLDVDVKGLDIEGHLPEGEVQVGDRKGKTGDTSLKGPLPTVHMPSMKMPQMPKADIKGPKVDITMPSLDVSLPKGTVDIQGPQVDMEAVIAEGDIKLGEKEVEVKDSKFKMPKFKMPSFGSSHRRLHKSSIDTPSCHESLDVSKSSPAFVHKEPEFSSVLQDDPLLCDSNLKVEGSKMKLHMPKMNIPSIGFSKDDSKVSKTSATVTCSSGETIMSSVDTSLPNLPATVGGTSGDILRSDIPVPETDTKKCDFKVQLPKIAFPGHQFDGTLKPDDLKISSKRSECAVNLCESELPEGELHVDIASSHLSDSHDGHSQFSGVSLRGLNFTKVNISGPHTEFGKTRVKEDITLTKYEVTLPMSESHDIPSLPHPDTIPILDRHSIHLKSEEEESQISAGTWDERVQPLSYDPDGMIKFPKFYKPKFGVSVSKPLEISHPQEPPNVAVEMTAQEEPILFPKKEFMTSSETVKSFMHLSSVQTSQEGSDQMAVSDIQDSNIAPQTGKAEEVKPECTESEGKEGFFKMPKFKLPSFSWSPKKEAASKGAPGSKPSDILDKEQVAADMETHTSSVETDMDVSTEKESPKEKIKKPHFMMPKIGLPKAKGSKAGIGLQKEAEELTHSDDAPIEEGSKKVIDTSSKKTVLDTKVFQIAAPTAIRQTELQVTEGLAPGKTTTQEPSGGKESGKEQLFLPVVQVPKLGSSVSQVKSHSIHISVPKLETDMSQPSPKVDIEAVTLETETYADVLKRNIDDKSLKLCQTTAGMLDSTISISEVSVPSGENTVSLLMPSLGFSTSEIKDPRQETGETVLPQHDISMPRPQAIAKGEKDVGLPESEMYLLPTEGPIKLKTSSTEIPSQVSMIETSRVWEGSVLTVKFPKLQVPKFTFQAPDTEADIFIPKVREEMCPETDIEIAIHKESPDEWSAKVLKAVSEIPPQPSPDPIRPPKDLALSSVASPISKVKVHIQGAHIESQEVTIESRVTCEHGELPRRETFSTQIVRASEIPPSDIQTPSYGFSLLKVKIPESHVNLDVTGKEQETLGYTSSTLETQDISEENLRKDELGVDTDVSLEGELQPETGEPYEIISSSASLPKLKTFTFEVHSSHQYVDSYSDEEPAEILEFPPEDSYDQIPPDEEKEQKVQSESKKSSGLFRFWLPSIGFSSSVDEANSDSKTEVSKSVPIQTQPEALSDIEPKKPEKTGWFRFPKLGFSSSPAKKSKSTEESVTEPTKSGSQEEAEQTVIFFDAQETLSPEEREGGEGITSTTNDDAQEPGSLVTSSARTELILLEEEGKTAGKTGSGHVAK